MVVGDDDEQMTIDERRKDLKRMRPRYQAADRIGRGRLLDAMHSCDAQRASRGGVSVEGSPEVFGLPLARASKS